MRRTMQWPDRLGFYCTFLTIYLISQIYILNHVSKFNKDAVSDGDFQNIFNHYKNLFLRLKVNSHLDTSGTYRIFNLKNSVNVISLFDVTLVSQCSPNHIHFIKHLCDSWKGPISVAVFTEFEYVEKTIWDLAKILHCKKFCNLALRLVVPSQGVDNKHFINEVKTPFKSENLISCEFFQFKKSERNYDRAIPYPINLLRNVAKSGSVTDFILIIDIDMVPNPRLRDDFLILWTEQSIGYKSVYVVPVFEIVSNVEIPKTKGELIELVKKKKSRPFYFVPCRNCQKYTGYNKWLSSNKTSDSRILHQVIWRHPWEPFFIAPIDVPDFDERFKQYGMNRISQICELHVAGYKFFILDNVFLVHRGFKTVGDFHAGKNVEMESNRKLYARFKEELKFKYPDSERLC